MLLRPRQKLFVERSLAALSTRDNTLGVAPTGAGKTIMLSAVTGEMIADGAKACVLAHRDELTAQNRSKFGRVNPRITTSVVDAKEKSWNGQVTFAMAPTLARTGNLAQLPALDLLVIDEAGQFSLAHTLAVSVSAKRLLLLGDPQQLPQVSQGAHPEPVDTSALGWLLGEHETIPEDVGYFLAETRRMRPELAELVSELAYEGRLHAHADAALREVEGAGPAGLVWHPVAHSGNSTSSLEEADEVVRIVQQALEGTIAEPGERPRPLSDGDLIVVAAYNAQVECVAEALAAAGHGGVRVGTVDRFQGQEAAIAIVTLAASSPEDVPRGLEFLLMRNRLNVAISRAQWAAHLVSSDRLGGGLPGSAEGVAALSGYLRLIESAQRAPDRAEMP